MVSDTLRELYRPVLSSIGGEHKNLIGSLNGLLLRIDEQGRKIHWHVYQQDIIKAESGVPKRDHKMDYK